MLLNHVNRIFDTWALAAITIGTTSPSQACHNVSILKANTAYQGTYSSRYFVVWHAPEML